MDMFGFISRGLDRSALRRALHDYPNYTPPFSGKAKLKRTQANANFAFFLEQRGARLEYLEKFLAKFAVSLRLAPEALPPLDNWLLRYGGHLAPQGGSTVDALEEYDPPWTGVFAGMNVVHDVSIFTGEYITKFNRNARWGLFVGDGKPGARDMMGYYHPCIFGIHSHHPEYNEVYPLYVAEQILHCCDGSRRRHEGTWLPCNRPEDFFRQWGDDNEFTRRLKHWADPDAPPPSPYTHVILR